MDLRGRNLVSITDYSKDEWMGILARAKYFESQYQAPLLHGKVIASLFFEPSTRTRLSFETATQRLGGSIIGFADSGVSSTKKGESLADSIRTIESYCDLIVMRHPVEGSARLASEISRVPVINAGDGSNQHPTQTLLDLYSINKTQDKLDGLTIGFAGDLKYGRTVHSLVQALAEYDVNFVFIAPKQLKIPEEIRGMLMERHINFTQLTEFGDSIKGLDVLYMTRIQKERFPEPAEYEQVKGAFRLTPDDLNDTKSSFKIMHPLPRVDEISVDVDRDERAYYFEQAKNGVFVRQAIITSILGVAL